jgi:hypothetical protein
LGSIISSVDQKTLDQLDAEIGNIMKEKSKSDLESKTQIPSTILTVSANEIINNYVKTCSNYKTISSKIKCLSWMGESSNPMECDHYVTEITFCRNHDQAEWIGKTSFFDDNGTCYPERSKLIRNIVNGQNFVYMTFYNPELDDKGGIHPRAYITTKDVKETQNQLLEYASNGGPLDGIIYGNNHKSVADLLSNASSLHLMGNQEEIAGTFCSVLEAVTKYGKVTAWITPDKGYNALKWSIHRTSQDFLDDKTLSEKGLKVCKSVFEASEIQKIGDQYIITKGGFTQEDITLDDQKNTRNNKYERTEVILNPDFEALRAFEINLPEGTVVSNEDIPCIKFVWTDGKLVPK